MIGKINESCYFNRTLGREKKDRTFCIKMTGKPISFNLDYCKSPGQTRFTMKWKDSSLREEWTISETSPGGLTAFRSALLPAEICKKCGRSPLLRVMMKRDQHVLPLSTPTHFSTLELKQLQPLSVIWHF